MLAPRRVSIEALFQQLPSSPMAPSLALEIFSITCGSSGEGLPTGTVRCGQKRSLLYLLGVPVVGSVPKRSIGYPMSYTSLYSIVFVFWKDVTTN